MSQHRMQQRSRSTAEQDDWVTDEDELDEDDEYEDDWPTRMPTSTRRYTNVADVRTQTGRYPADVQAHSRQRRDISDDERTNTRANGIPARRSATQVGMPAVSPNKRQVDTEEAQIRHSRAISWGEDRPRLRLHWLVYLGVAMLIMIAGWVALSAFLGWWQVTQDDWHYGRPRTYQTDYVVGHNDSAASPSHFMALNLNRRVEVLEFPGGDSSKAKIYMGPVLIGQGQDLAVVTLSFKDVNGDGKLDMVVNVQDSRFVYINDKGGFRPARPDENIRL